MKIKNDKKENPTVQGLREIRDKIGSEIKDITYKQLKKYIEEKLTLHPTSVWQKRG